MIVDANLLVKHLANYLADYAKKAGRTMFVVNNRGTRQDQVVAQICHEAAQVHGGLSAHIHTRRWPQSMVGATETDEFVGCHVFAGDNNGIVVGSIDRTYGLYYRSFGKIGEALADIFPLFDLEYSEIIQLYEYLFGEFTGEDPPGYEMIEWCNNAELNYGIITRSEPPHMHPRWPYFTQEQKKWIATIHQREKKTRHKTLTRPYCPISDKPQCKRNAR